MSITIKQAIDGFLLNCKVECKSWGTIDCYRDKLKGFLWYATNYDWSDDPQSIDSWKVREFLAYAGNAKNRWGTTGNGSENCRDPSKAGGWRYYRTLRHFFNWAVSEGFLQKTPLSNIKPNPPKEKPAELYTAEEIDID